MKTTKLFLMMTIAGLAFASCSEQVNDVDDSINTEVTEKSAEVAALCGTCDFSATLSDEEESGLIEMREEEKLAREVYLFLNAKFNYRVFANIAKSENAHTSAVLYLLEGFGISDPTPAEATEFFDPKFTEMYAQLTEKGSVSLIEALKVGALIEETDIADLKIHIGETSNATIKKVYGNLLRGSEFHLKAFVNGLKLQGVTYTPAVLTQEEYNDILGI